MIIGLEIVALVVLLLAILGFAGFIGIYLSALRVIRAAQ
jgi:hypothetical protein